MNRKQKIIVSVTGIFIVLLALVGITFAYFLTRIQGNTNTTSITATTADLRLVYGDGNGDISATSIEPGWINDGESGRPEPKTFTVTNEGNTTVEGFKIYLEDVRNSLARKEDLIYTITCENITTATDGNATSNTCGHFTVVENEITSDRELIFPSVMSLIATDTLDEGETHTYTIIVEYKNLTDVDQSEDMGKTFSARVNIYDAKTKFLATEIMTNVKDNSDLAETTGSKYVKPDQLGIAENTTIPGQAISLASEKLVSYTFDDYGTSYYYRGNVVDNYVMYSGKCWRIVRIQGDGSIKLALSNDYGQCTTNGTDTAFAMDTSGKEYGTIKYKELPNNEPEDLYFQYSNIVSYLNDWIAEVDLDTSKLITTNYCNDNSISTINTGMVHWYNGQVRLGKNSMPSLMCNMTGLNDSAAIKYPHQIGILSADEVAYAGSANSGNYKDLETITSYLLSNATHTSYWTMTPYYYTYGGTGTVFVVNSNGYLETKVVNGDSYAVRPVITLKNDVTILEGGNGEIDTPYVIG